MSSSNSTNGGHPLDDLAAYALDALDDAGRAAVADHVAQCLTCRDELDAHYETLAQLAPDEAPPAAVWQRVAASIGAPSLPDPHAAEQGQLPRTSPGSSGQRDRPADGAPDEGDGRDATVHPMAPPATAEPSRSASGLRLGWMAAAACLAVALGVGGTLGFALASSGDADTDIGTLAEQAAEDPDGELATLVSTSGDPLARVVADEDGAYVVLDGLENLPEGRAYQLWSLTDSEPVSLGMLGREGSNTVAFRLPPTITELAITEAPTNGDAVPNGQFLASGPVTQS